MQTLLRVHAVNDTAMKAHLPVISGEACAALSATT
jgi:hypothetical protein